MQLIHVGEGEFMPKPRKHVIVLISFLVIVTLLLIPATYYSLQYMNWKSMSQGYPELYQQAEYYELAAAPSYLIESPEWKKISSDAENDGVVPNWSDVKSLQSLSHGDTLWFRYELYNHIDLNEPMVSLALDIDNDPNNGTDWYGTTPDFYFDKIIAAGYTREGVNYKGYNFFGDKKGVCVLSYDLASDCYFLGIAHETIKDYKGARFVAAVGNKALWNDDVDGIFVLTFPDSAD